MIPLTIVKTGQVNYDHKACQNSWNTDYLKVIKCLWEKRSY